MKDGKFRYYLNDFHLLKKGSCCFVRVVWDYGIVCVSTCTKSSNSKRKDKTQPSRTARWSNSFCNTPYHSSEALHAAECKIRMHWLSRCYLPYLNEPFDKRNNDHESIHTQTTPPIFLVQPSSLLLASTPTHPLSNPVGTRPHTIPSNGSLNTINYPIISVYTMKPVSLLRACSAAAEGTGGSNLCILKYDVSWMFQSQKCAWQQ